MKRLLPLILVLLPGLAFAQGVVGLSFIPPITPGHCVDWFTYGVLQDSGSACGGGGGGVAQLIAGTNITLSPTNGLGTVTINSTGGGASTFTSITSGTNTAAAMVVGTGATLGVSGSGTINATTLGSATFASPGAIGGTTPAAVTGTAITGSSITDSGITGLTQCVHASSAGLLSGTGSDCGSGGSTAFSALTSGTNTTAAMVIGTGGSLGVTGSGTNTATAVPVTGVTGMGTGVGTFLVTPSSANLAAAVTGETGTGSLVFGTAPSISSPTVATAETLSFITGLTQCLHVNSSGVLSGTGADCGSGGSGTVNSGTAGDLAYYATTGTAVSQATVGSGLTLASGNLTTTAVLNAQTGTTYTILATDSSKLVTFSNASATAVTLPVATTTGFGAGFSFDVQNKGVGTVTITPTTSTINGSSTLVVATNQGCSVTSDGTNYQVSACTALSAGGGSGTVNSGTANQLAYYASSGTAVSGATVGAGLSVSSGTVVTTSAINAQTSTTYTFVSTDATKLVTFNNASAIAVTLPVATTTGFGAGFSLDVQDLGAGTVTITPTTSTINGASILTIAQNRGCSITSDGTNYQVSACTAQVSGGSAAFSAITSATNTTAAMVVGTGASLAVSGSGTIAATNTTGVNGAAVPTSAAVLASNGSNQLVSATTVSYIIDGGTKFTAAGTGTCATITTTLGGTAAGKMTCTGTSGASTITITLPTATNGWVCEGNDLTTTTDLVHQTGGSTTTCVLSGTLVANDVVNFMAMGY